MIKQANTGVQVKNKVTKNIKHDSLTVKVVYPNGEFLDFRIGRGGERIKGAIKNAEMINAYFKMILEFCDWKKDKDNLARIERIADMFGSVENIEELIKRIS